MKQFITGLGKMGYFGNRTLKKMATNEIDTDKSAFCRICATVNSADMFSIYSKEGELWDIVEKIGRCLPIVVLPTDSLPLNICKECLAKLNSSYELVITSLTSDEKLRAKFDKIDSCLEPLEIKTLNIQKSSENEDISMGDIYEKTEVENGDAENACPVLNIYGPATCDLCDENFSDMEEFDDHVAKEHLQQSQWQCSRCDESFEQSHDLVEHKSNIHGEAPVSCNRCHDQVEEEWLDEHNFLHCELCKIGFSTEEKLRDHHNMAHGPRQQVCNKCGLKCDSLYELSVHKRSHARSGKERRSAGGFVCEVCKKVFSERVVFNIHRTKCKNKQYTCSVCKKVFWREYSLQLHMKIHDPEFWDRFKCQICQRPFRDKHALKNHMQLHYGIKPHMCDLCGRTYNRYANMLKHRKLHKPQSMWEHNCNHCESKFERLKDLMAHIEHAHTEDGGGDTEEKKSGLKWICRFCGKRISTKLSLQDHERIHTGAKPYICEWCGREFRSRPNLLQHHLTHTGDRKHACGVCGKRFARKSFIAQHMRVHTGEKPFECDICGKRFTQAGDMRRHRNRHDKNVIYVANV
ncbi:hypothetical protein C0J52_07578 [Blattella germanica]|nr:hypothetical protein C0J52_07578 [Blattella germanica]